MAKYETMLVTTATLDEEATAALVGKMCIRDSMYTTRVKRTTPRYLRR